MNMATINISAARGGDIIEGDMLINIDSIEWA